MVSSPEAAWWSSDVVAWLLVVVRLAWSVWLLPMGGRCSDGGAAAAGAGGEGCVCSDGMRWSPGIPKLVRSMAGAPVSDDENGKLFEPAPLDLPPPKRKDGSRRMVVVIAGAEEDVVVGKVLAPNVVETAAAAAGVVVVVCCCCNCCRGMDGIGEEVDAKEVLDAVLLLLIGAAVEDWVVVVVVVVVCTEVVEEEEAIGWVGGIGQMSERASE